jgi:hypothetical protein
MRAGTSVRETARLTTTVRAIPGPKARKNSSCPARRAAAPQATISPAVATMGRNWPVAPIAASTGDVPSASRRRMPERKKTE